MIEYWSGYGNGNKEIQIVVRGHAGYDEKGKDIVCAAVSILATAAAAAAHQSGLLILDWTGDGQEIVRMHVGGESMHYLWMYQIGMRMLCDNYPDHVRHMGEDEARAVISSNQEVTV